MKILYIDTPSIQNSIRIALMEQMTNHQILLIDNEEKAVEAFMKDPAEILIYDPSVPASSDVVEKLLFINPRQQCISLSDSVACADKEGCDNCLANYNRRAVKKEEGLHSLLYMIDNFNEMSCEFATDKLGSSLP